MQILLRVHNSALILILKRVLEIVETMARLKFYVHLGIVISYIFLHALKLLQFISAMFSVDCCNARMVCIRMCTVEDALELLHFKVVKSAGIKTL